MRPPRPADVPADGDAKDVPDCGRLTVNPRNEKSTSGGRWCGALRHDAGGHAAAAGWAVGLFTAGGPTGGLAGRRPDRYGECKERRGSGSR
eukprot:m.41632 g.41632  ORF g.41632 m.41632 type:complete len:91 (+) comp14244_c0_seq1:66-338(+)